MAHSYAEALNAELDSLACGIAGLRRKDIARYAECVGGCGIQTEASDIGMGGISSGRDTSNSDSPTCCGSGMRTKYISRLTGARGGCAGQAEASDTGIGGTGSYGTDPKTIIPKRFHDKTNTSAHRIRNESMSAPENNSGNTRCDGNAFRRKTVEKMTCARFIKSRGGRDETYDNGKACTISMGESHGFDNGSHPTYLLEYSHCYHKAYDSVCHIEDESMSRTMTQRTFFQSSQFKGRCDGQDESCDSIKGGTDSHDNSDPHDLPYKHRYNNVNNSARDESISGPMTKQASLHFHSTELTGGCDGQDKAYDSDQGGTSGGGINPRPPPSPGIALRPSLKAKHERGYFHSTKFVGDTDTQTEISDSGYSSGEPSEPSSGGSGSNAVLTMVRTSFDREVRRYPRSLVKRLPD